MNSWKTKLSDLFTNEETRKYLHFFSIPLLAIVLILIIMAFDQPNKDLVASKSTATSTKESQMDSNQATSSLQQDTIPEINEFIESFFQAKKSRNLERIQAAFGGTYTGDLALEQAQIDAEAIAIENYFDLTCYTLPGLTPDSYVVFSDFDIKFYGAETSIPSLLVSYVKKAEDGNYYFEYEFSEEISQLIEQASQLEKIQTLLTDMEIELKLALESDQNLVSVYYALYPEEITSKQIQVPAEETTLSETSTTELTESVTSE